MMMMMLVQIDCITTRGHQSGFSSGKNSKHCGRNMEAPVLAATSSQTPETDHQLLHMRGWL